MAEEQDTGFSYVFNDSGEQVHFSSPQELQTWATKEFSKWNWLNQAPLGTVLFGAYQHFYNTISQAIPQWSNALQNPQQLQGTLNSIRNVFDQVYKQQQILVSTSTEALWLFDLNQKSGPAIATGAYFAILGKDLQQTITQPALIEGMIEGFLYKHEIKWTATAHKQALNQLKKTYADNIVEQDARFRDIDKQQAALVDSFTQTLTEKTADLDKLHASQADEFQAALTKHLENLTSIELTYDQKLALQKPVEYWQKKETDHKSSAKFFGWVSLGIAVAMVAALGTLAYVVFGATPEGKIPKEWQLGVFAVAAFFSVWLVRILVRMFFSHHHLATDAAERSIMVLTYLSLAREGSQFAPEDKTLIIQNLFRTASDGLVKDDAAPKTPLELLTR